MKAFLEKHVNYFCLFSLFVIKSMVYSSGIVDALILGVITLAILGEKISNRYFDVKEKYINENQFRSQVNTDMAKLLQDVSQLKMANYNPLNTALRKK